MNNLNTNFSSIHIIFFTLVFSPNRLFVKHLIVAQFKQLLNEKYICTILFFFLQEQEIFLTCFQSHNGEATEIPLEIVYTPEISDRCLKVRL